MTYHYDYTDDRSGAIIGLMMAALSGAMMGSALTGIFFILWG